MTIPKDNAIRILVAICRDADSLEDSDFTPEENARAARMLAHVRARLHAPQAFPGPFGLDDVDIVDAKPIVPEIVVMPRSDVIAALERIERAGQLQLAFRSLSELSDDDLRRVLQDARDETLEPA